MSDGVEWAIHCCTLLAVLPGDARLPAKRLAEFHAVPSAYLAKHLQALASAGIVTSSPGRHGGYRLARPAAEISLLDIVLAIDGDSPAFTCTEIRRRGPSAVPARHYTPLCGIAAAMGDAEQAWRTSLARQTVRGMVEDAIRFSPPAAQEKAIDWIRSVGGEPMEVS